MYSSGMDNYDTTWSFACRYCEHDNQEVDAQYDRRDVWADCVSCGEQNEESLGDYRDRRYDG
jgi:hypothetical protein